MDDKVPFIVLAGSPPERDALMEYADIDYKALIDVNGKTMLTRVLEAIRDSERASYILIVGLPKQLVDLPQGIDSDRVGFYEIEGKQVDKIIKSCMHLLSLGKEDPSIFPRGTNHAVITTSDIPAISGETISKYLDECFLTDHAFYYCVVDREHMESMFPNSGRSWIKMDGNQYCGADLALFDVTYAEQSYDILKIITENRKSFTKALFKASPLTFFRYILKLARMKDVERLMTKIFGFPSKLIIDEDARIAFDVDKPFQLDIMRSFLSSYEGGTH